MKADKYSWPITKKLLNAILADRVSDNFVSKLIWERLGYIPDINSNGQGANHLI